MRQVLVIFLALSCFYPTVSMGIDGSQIYTDKCASCHDSNNAQIPSMSVLKRLNPGTIVRALDRGVMRQLGSSLSKAERVSVAEYLSGRRLVSEKSIDSKLRYCKSNPQLPVDFMHQAGWDGWGGDLENSRYQAAKAAALDAKDLPSLKLKWVFAYPDEVLALGPINVFGGRIFVPSNSGNIYSLDAESACVYWRFEADSSVRTAINVGQAENGSEQFALYFTDTTASTYAVDASSGELIWKTRVDSHPAVRVTGAAQLYQNRLYVPVSTLEAVTSADPDYICCTQRGSVVALDAYTGKIIWQSYTIEQEPRASTALNSRGTSFYGPSGAGIWSAPTIDTKLNVLYVGTGENSSQPATDSSDAILAMDLEDGKILWKYQGTGDDVWNAACLSGERINCPDNEGPDYDFGASPILVELDDKRRALLASQKSGVVHALDPDNKGQLLWKQQASPGGFMGGIMWGAASDGENIYVALSDRKGKLITDKEGKTDWQLQSSQGGGVHAYRVRDGKLLWRAPAPVRGDRPQCSPAQAGAVSAIPGAVFAGAYDGHIRAYSSNTGQVLWDYDTVRQYPAVNGIVAQGGALDGAGPTIVNGTVYVNSGYARWGGMPGNALLAFETEED